MDVRLNGVEHFRLKQHVFQIQPFKGVPLHGLHHAGGEIFADIPQPAGHAGRGRSTAAAQAARAFRLIVQGGERLAHFQIFRAQRHVIATLPRFLTKSQHPAAHTFRFVACFHRVPHSLCLFQPQKPSQKRHGQGRAFFVPCLARK